MIQPEETQKFRHVAIFEELRRRIEGGDYAPGDRLPSFTELRAEFAASEDTIERVFTALESDGMVVRKHRIGTFVAGPDNAAAEAPRSRPRPRQGALGALIPQQLQNDSYYARILCGIQSAARAADVDVVLLTESSKPRWEKVDGVVTLGPTPGYPAPPPGMPIVSLLHDRREAVCVYNDDEGGARQLTEHLLRLGHRKIGYMHAALLSPVDWEYGSNNITEARIRGYRETLRAAGIEAPGEWLRPVLTVEDRTTVGHSGRGYTDHRILGRVAMDKWLKNGWTSLGCSAMLAQNDLAAIGMIESFRAAGLRVPEDVSVVGFDGHPAGEYFSPRLTTVFIPLEAVAARGAELLLQQVHAPIASRRARSRPAQTQPAVFSGELKVGESSTRRPHA